MTPDEQPPLPDSPGGEGRPERWRRIPASRLLGVPRGYEASSLGNIRSVPRTLRDGRAAGGTVLKPWLDDDGYEVVQLGRSKVHVHVAVALAFHGRPEVRHLRGNRRDNRPEGLAWGSHWENEQDKKRTERETNREVGLRPSEIGTFRTGDLP